MSLKPKPLQIDPENPFGANELKRQQFVEPLNGLLKTAEDSFVLTVEAPWGWGKTTFLKMWIAELKKGNSPVVYFNAWENDFSGTPLVSLLAELDLALPELLPLSQAEQSLETLRSAGGRFLKHAFPVALKLATSGLVDLQGGVSDDVKQAFADVSESVATEFVGNYSVAKSSLAEFKRKMADVASELMLENDDAFPLTIFIDELDRCRPDYALEMLEAVKHLFNVPHVNFVLAMNREQIEQSVRAVYGSGINASEYLRRFVDLSFSLPEPDTESFVPIVMQQLGISEDLDRRSTAFKFDFGQPNGITGALVNLFTLFSLSLRTQEQILTQLSVILRMTPPEKNIYPEVLSIMLALHALDRKLYRRFVTGKAGSDVIGWIRSDPQRRDFLKSDHGIGVEGWLLMCDHDRNSDQIAAYRATADNAGVSENDRDHAQTLIQFCDAIGRYFPGNRVVHDVIQPLARRIDLLENFTPSIEPA